MTKGGSSDQNPPLLQPPGQQGTGASQQGSAAGALQQNIFDSGPFTTSTTAVTPTQPQAQQQQQQPAGSSEWDPELSRIINEVIDYVPEPFLLGSGVVATTSGAAGVAGGSLIVDSVSSAMDQVESAVVAAASAQASVAATPASAAMITTSAVAGAAGGSVVSVASNAAPNRTMMAPGPIPQMSGHMHAGGNGASAAVGGLQLGGHINDKQAAISEIEKALRQCETVSPYSGSPPAYPMHVVGPPNKFLTARGLNGPLFGNNGLQGGLAVGMSGMNNNNSSSNNGHGFSMPSAYAQQQQQRPVVGVAQQQQQRLAMGQLPRYQNIQQQQQHERLLQEQQKQQLVVPVNATQTGLNPGLADIGSLINNTVAPNVSLQRNNSVVRETQRSPGFNSNAFQQMSPGQPNRAGGPSAGGGGGAGGPAFSPVQMGKPQVVVGGGAQQQQQQQGPPPNYQQFSGSGAGNVQGDLPPMSPQFGGPDMMSMMGMAAGKATGGVLAQQLSPRQPPFSSPQSNQWTQQQQAQQQLSLQQQQNPMLNAQLTVS